MSEKSRYTPDQPPTATAHWLDLELSGSGWLSATWRCPHAFPATCWSLCHESECEEGCVAPDLHEHDPIDYCNIVTWLSDEVWDEEYVGATHPVESGWIEPRWTGDRYGWVYLDAATQSNP